MDWKGFAGLIALGMVLLMSLQAVAAQTGEPDPADNITAGASGSYTGLATGYPISAQAGNVTAMSVSNIESAEFWQGYYGNLSGEIRLSDANNNTLFSWALANPSGEIYAVNTSTGISWDNVTCVNLTNTTGGLVDMGSASKINRSSIQSAYNLTDQDYENLTATFNQTGTGITVGARTLDGDRCYGLNTYVNGEFQTASFNELLLFDNDSALIFAAILEENVDGFESGGNDLHDFQMMVLEDGSAGGPDDSLTTYYFYVELE